eukprot:5086003-Pyramimonas_sp.AAC.1
MPPKKKGRTGSPSPIRPWDDGLGTEQRDFRAEAIAADAFLEELIDMYLMGKKMSAKHLCILCHHASNAGIQAASKFAMPPQRATGNYQKKLDSVLELPQFDEDLYELEIPGLSSNDLERSPQTVHLVPPHEVLAREVEQHPEILEQWAKGIEEAWIDDFENNPLVRTLGPDEKKKLLPCQLYLDKTPFTKKDGFLGIYVNLVQSGRRHM